MTPRPLGVGVGGLVILLALTLTLTPSPTLFLAQHAVEGVLCERKTRVSAASGC